MILPVVYINSGAPRHGKHHIKAKLHDLEPRVGETSVVFFQTCEKQEMNPLGDLFFLQVLQLAAIVFIASEKLSKSPLSHNPHLVFMEL